MEKIIDTHLHMAYDGLGGLTEMFKVSDGEAFVEYMNRNNVAHGIILSGGEYEGTIGPNIDVCALAHKYPDKFSWLCNVDITNQENLEERLAHYKALGAKGVGEFVMNYRLDDSRVQALLAACEKQDMAFLFHMSPKEGFNYGIIDEFGLPLLEDALKKYPNLRLVGHSQPVWYEIGGDMPSDYDKRNEYPEGPVKPGGRLPELLNKYKNFYCDLSANSAGNAIMRDPEFGYQFLEKFQDQLIFATDMVNVEMYFPLLDFLKEAVKENKISKEAYEKICFSNAIHVFGLQNIN
ncbi:amidohydrolase family protein [Proteiniclasticum sp. SCR006]|uniref:Amidohydrolase family protein n=1 Tax=Proteiniclasticum aestuarii TaxID=2817862 RepID=A0A939H9Q8_9CLOT|nr:amidohydrolase family protein [Proteiniclasticum aestuarii]MBO1264071.1 amidohydrolase family protein [Proteiniclasticum aestuarii]